MQDISTKLLSVNDEAMRQIIHAIRTCKQSTDKSDSFSGDDELYVLGEDDEKLFKFCVDHKHLTPLEHVVFSFETDLSRVALGHITRHRTGSYSVESQRSVKPDKYFVPESFITAKVENLYYKHMLASFQLYDDFVKIGIPKEDARYVLSQSTQGVAIMTIDLRNLRHFLSERLCFKTLHETRNIAVEMAHIVHEVNPLFLYHFEKCRGCPSFYKQKCKGYLNANSRI